MTDGFFAPQVGAVPAAPFRQLPLAEVERFLLEGMPVAAIAHSFHVDALADPALRRDPLFQRFSVIELNELHHQVAALGAIQRLKMGDQTALTSLGLNLAGFLQNRQAALALAQQFRPAVLQHPALRAMFSLVQQSNQQIAANWPVVQQAILATGAPAPGPMLVSLAAH